MVVEAPFWAERSVFAQCNIPGDVVVLINFVEAAAYSGVHVAVSISYKSVTYATDRHVTLLRDAAVLERGGGARRASRGAQPASRCVRREQLSPRRHCARAGQRPSTCNTVASQVAAGQPSMIMELYVPARSSQLHGSSCIHHLRLARVKVRSLLCPGRTSCPQLCASLVCTPQAGMHRRSAERTSCWRAERRGYHHRLVQIERRGRSRPSARAAARSVAL